MLKKQAELPSISGTYVLNAVIKPLCNFVTWWTA